LRLNIQFDTENKNINKLSKKSDALITSSSRSPLESDCIAHVVHQCKE